MQTASIRIPAMFESTIAIDSHDRIADDQSQERKDVDDAWAAVSLDRLAAYREGRTTASPVDAALKRIRESRPL